MFPKDKIIHWLSWLAEKMKEHSQSVFLVEGLQPSWLGTRVKRVAYGALAALSIGLIVGMAVGLLVGMIVWLGDGPRYGLRLGLVFGLSSVLIIFVGVGLGCWSKSPLKNAVTSGSIGGLITGMVGGMVVGLSKGPNIAASAGMTIGLIAGLIVCMIGGLGIGSLNHITLVETMSWKWKQFMKRTIPGSTLGLNYALICGIIRGFLEGPSIGLRVALIGGLSYGLLFGLVSGLIGGLAERVKVGKASPNEGIKLSRKNSLKQSSRAASGG